MRETRERLFDSLRRKDVRVQKTPFSIDLLSTNGLILMVFRGEPDCADDS